MQKERALWKRFLQSARTFFSSPPRITENSSLREVLRHYPEGRSVFLTNYNLSLTASDLGKSLRQLSEAHALPPPQILFMEMQLAAKNRRISQVSPAEARDLIEQDHSAVVVDVREPHEWHHHRGLLGAIQCEQTALQSAFANLPPTTPLVLYCHFGVRSLDFAHWLADQGFTSVFVIRGGLDAWSLQIDPSIPRYDGTYC